MSLHKSTTLSAGRPQPIEKETHFLFRFRTRLVPLVSSYVYVAYPDVNNTTRAHSGTFIVSTHSSSEVLFMFTESTLYQVVLRLDLQIKFVTYDVAFFVIYLIECIPDGAFDSISRKT